MKKIVIIFLVLTCLLVSLFLNSIKTSGDLVLVGGGKIHPSILRWVFDRKPKGKILLVNNDGIASYKWDELFLSGNIVQVILPEQLTIAKLTGVGALFIDGGHQYEHLRRLNASVIQHAHEHGILILGTSAGAMILGEFYFSAQHGGITSEEANANPNERRVCVDSNFLKIKVLKNTLIDSHYAERERQGRLQVFLEKGSKHGLYKGIGIDESTALCIKGNLESEVIGAGGVHFVTKSIQGNSHISLYQDGTSSNSHLPER